MEENYVKKERHFSLSNYTRADRFLKKYKASVANSEVNKFKMFSLTSCIIMTCICLSGLFLPSSVIESKNAYIFILFSSLLFFIIFHFESKIKKQSENFTVLSIYIFLVIYYAFAIYTSNFVSTNYPAVTFIALQLIFPVLILDYHLRINIAIICMYIINLFFAYKYKPYNIFLVDLISTSGFTFAGIIIGNYTRQLQIESIQKSQELLIQSKTDILTSLLNRRVLFEVLDNCAQHKAEKPVTGVIMIDIDFFKQYNDTFGHQAGDLCLQLLGKLFIDFGKKYYLDFYRYGGEEFIALSKDYNYLKLGEISKLLLTDVKNLDIKFPVTKSKTITISIGYAHKNNCYSQSYDELIQLADKALYTSKTTGRNRTTGYLETK